MKGTSEGRTSPTLLGRLARAPHDQAAWSTFVACYGPQIYDWCRQGALQDADAQDVTQTVLLKLARKLGTFTYDPASSFRGWLKTLTRHAYSDFLQSRKRAGTGSGDTQVLGWLETVEAREELVKRLEKEFDRELMEEAMARVRLRVEPRTWEAFQLLALEAFSGKEAAARLNMKIASVLVARSRVQKMLQAEIEKLEEPERDTSGELP
jgi:RNA polymerase sigma-70 factor (ECF subfamily)